MKGKDVHSYASYCRQLNGWEQQLTQGLTNLHRIRRKSNSKKLKNTIESLQTDIQAQIFRYNKQKQKVNYSYQRNMDFDQILGHYKNYSKRYLLLLQQIQSISKEYSDVDVIQKENQEINSHQKKIPIAKSYMVDTYCTKQSYPKRSAGKKKSHSKWKYQIESQWMGGLLKQFSQPNQENLKRNNAQRHKLSKQIEKDRLFGEGSGEVYALKRQLQDVKHNMLDLDRRVEEHAHQSYEQQIRSLGLRNNKMLAELKMIKQQNGELIENLHRIKRELGKKAKYQRVEDQSAKDDQKRITDFSTRKQEQDTKIAEWVKKKLSNSKKPK